MHIQSHANFTTLKFQDIFDSSGAKISSIKYWLLIKRDLMLSSFNKTETEENWELNEGVLGLKIWLFKSFNG